MGYYPGQMKPEQPGIDGILYARRLGFIYYAATAKKLFMRGAVAPGTLEAKGEPEHGPAFDFQLLARAGASSLLLRKSHRPEGDCSNNGCS